MGVCQSTAAIPSDAINARAVYDGCAFVTNNRLNTSLVNPKMTTVCESLHQFVPLAARISRNGKFAVMFTPADILCDANLISEGRLHKYELNLLHEDVRNLPNDIVLDDGSFVLARVDSSAIHIFSFTGSIFDLRLIWVNPRFAMRHVETLAAEGTVDCMRLAVATNGSGHIRESQAFLITVSARETTTTTLDILPEEAVANICFGPNRIITVCQKYTVSVFQDSVLLYRIDADTNVKFISCVPVAGGVMTLDMFGLLVFRPYRKNWTIVFARRMWGRQISIAGQWLMITGDQACLYDQRVCLDTFARQSLQTAIVCTLRLRLPQIPRELWMIIWDFLFKDLKFPTVL